jgi:hypothetical protein
VGIAHKIGRINSQQPNYKWERINAKTIKSQGFKMNLKPVSLFITVLSTSMATTLISIPNADARPQSNRVRHQTTATPSEPSTVTGKGNTSVSAGAYGANPSYSMSTSGDATSPTNANTRSSVSLLKNPGGTTVPSNQVTFFGTTATQTSEAGKVSGSGTAASNITAEQGRVTATSQSEATLTGGKNGSVSSHSDASLNSATKTGGANAGFTFSGSDQDN